MAFLVKRVEYFNVTAAGQAGAGARLLSAFAEAGVNLLAFKAVPLETTCTRFTLFPDDGSKMIAGAKQTGLELDGPHPALLIEGNDQSGALADIFEKLSRAGIQVDEAGGIAGINAGYGVVLYLRQEDCQKAAAALEV